MGEPGLRPEERKLKSLIASLDLVSPQDLNMAADDVRLIRQYGGNVDLKQRLVDLELVGPRQLDAIERGLGMKPRDESPAAAQEGASEEKAYIDMSRLAGGVSGASGTAAVGNLNLEPLRTSDGEGREGFHQRPIPGAEESKEGSSEKGKKPKGKAIKGGFVPSWKKRKGEEPEEVEEEEEEEVVEEKPKAGGPPTLAEQAERIKHVIKHIVHSRQHEQILDFLIRRKMNVVEPAEVAKALELSQRQVRDVLDDLKASRVIKDIGTHPYALSPGPKELRDLKFFLQMWQRRDWHSKMLAWLLDEEKKRGG